MLPIETKIRDLVARGELQQAMAEVKAAVQKTDDQENLNALAELQGQLTLLNQEKNTGLLNEDDAARQRAQIDMRFLNTFTDLKISDGDHPTRVFNNKILFYACNPTDKAKTQMNKECALIKEIFDAAHIDFTMKEESIPGAMIDDVISLKPGIVHFSGHGLDDHEDGAPGAPGDATEGIILKNAQGEICSASEDTLHKLFVDLNEIFQIDVVFLNACHSSNQAEAIKNIIPYVVCMNAAIPVDIAIQFAAHFYKWLFTTNNNVKAAFDLARVAMKMDNTPGADVPVLYEKK